MDTIIAKT